MGQQYERLSLNDLAGGLNTAQHPSRIRDNESPDCFNVEFDGGTVQPINGQRKLNNQKLVRSGLLVGAAVDGAAISALPGKSVPARGYGFIPYSPGQDIGGVLRARTNTTLPAAHQTTWHAQRGRSFHVQVSFRLPEDTRLFASPRIGELTTAPTFTELGADNALDAFSAIIQKGGDRLTPMSWALGIVNVSDLPERGGLPSVSERRVSNYALCFMWLDAPQFGIARPVQCRYRLDAGAIRSEESTYVADTHGRYSTLAYRAILIPHFVRPGVDYHVAVRLKLDTGTAGGGEQPGVDGEAVAWNDDGLFEVYVSESFTPAARYLFEVGTATTLDIYKGPSDSLEYLTKYGIRYWGPDAMFLGMNMRFAPWASGGFVPFGIDSAPLEAGGYALVDQSVHGAMASVYAERARPEERIHGGNPAASQLYDLKIAHDHAKDPTGKLFEVNQRGLVRHLGAAGVIWGMQTAVWADIAVQGRSPWGPTTREWAGLGGLTAAPASGFNEEALRGCRLVFGAAAAGGFSALGAAGGLLSIERYVAADAYAAPTYAGQHIVTEWGILGASTWAAGNFVVGIRVFRWVQIPTVVCDVRVAPGEPGAWDTYYEYALTHDGELAGKRLPRVSGWWRMDDAGGGRLRDRAGDTDGYVAPFSVSAAESPLGGNGVFLSGEGEALQLNLGGDGELAGALRAALRSGRSGCAIQITFRSTEAFYGLRQHFPDEAQFYNVGLGSYRGRHRFAPPLLSWEVMAGDRDGVDGVVGAQSGDDALQHDTFDGRLSRPQPLLELTHSADVSPSNTTTQLWPMGFCLMVPLRDDQHAHDAWCPEALRTWVTGTGQSRFALDAPWVGRRLTLQIGLEPTGTKDEYRIYLAGDPADALFPGASGEAAIFATETIRSRDLERSVITVGGRRSPRQLDYYDAAQNKWFSRGRSVWETGARMVVEQVTVIASSTPGSLPAASGGASGKISGPDSLPRRALAEGDIAVRVGGLADISDATATFDRALSTLDRSLDATSILRTLVLVDGYGLSLSRRDALPVTRPTPLFVTGVAGNVATFHRSTGQIRPGAAVFALRAVSTMSFSERDDEPISIGGDGYDIDLATSGSALESGPLFSSNSPVADGWIVRVYSNVKPGAALRLTPRWARGCKRATELPVRGLHFWNGRLIAAGAGSVFEADDRWRTEGGVSRLAFRSGLKSGRLLPEQFDHVLCASATPPWDMTRRTSDVVRIDATLKLEASDCVRTIAWAGNYADQLPGQWRFAVESGLLRLDLGWMSVATARSSVAIPLGREAHVRAQVTFDPVDVSRVDFWIDGVYAGGQAISFPGGAMALPVTNLVLGCALGPFSETIRGPGYTLVQSAVLAPMAPEALYGLLDSLGGELGSLVVSATHTSGPHVAPNSYVPKAERLLGADTLIEINLDAGWGHTINSGLGVILSSPAISLSHEMGSEFETWSFADGDGEVFVANGKVAVIE